jgi:hypothetical protein
MRTICVVAGCAWLAAGLNTPDAADGVFRETGETVCTPASVATESGAPGSQGNPELPPGPLSPTPAMTAVAAGMGDSMMDAASGVTDFHSRILEICISRCRANPYYTGMLAGYSFVFPFGGAMYGGFYAGCVAGCYVAYASRW